MSLALEVFLRRNTVGRDEAARVSDTHACLTPCGHKVQQWGRCISWLPSYPVSAVHNEAIPVDNPLRVPCPWPSTLQPAKNLRGEQ